MSGVPEESVFEDDIYELTMTDKATGGRGGIANRQAQQLANRTRWLKERLADLQDQQITSIAVNDDGHLLITMADESVQDLGSVTGSTGVGMPAGGLVGQMPVKASLDDYDFVWVDHPADGTDGAGVTGVAINEDGHLIFALSSGAFIDAGALPGESGGIGAVVAGAGIKVDGTDPANPVVSMAPGYGVSGAYPLDCDASILSAAGYGKLATDDQWHVTASYIQTGDIPDGTASPNQATLAAPTGYPAGPVLSRPVNVPVACQANIISCNAGSGDTVLPKGMFLAIVTAGGGLAGFISTSFQLMSGAVSAHRDINGVTSTDIAVPDITDMTGLNMSIYVNPDGSIGTTTAGIHRGIVPGITVGATDRIFWGLLADDNVGATEGIETRLALVTGAAGITEPVPAGSVDSFGQSIARSRSATFIENLTVTVSSAGGDYTSWDEMYSAVSLLRGANLTVIIGEEGQTNLRPIYDFRSWDKAVIDASAVGLTFSSSAQLRAQGSANMYAETSMLIGNITVTSGDLDICGFSVAGAYTLESSSGGQINVKDVNWQQTGFSFVGGQLNISGNCIVSGNIIMPSSMQMFVLGQAEIGSVELTGSNIFIANAGVLEVGTVTNNAAGPVTSLIECANGGRVNALYIDAGSNGVTRVFNVGGGSNAAVSSTPTGTYSALANVTKNTLSVHGVVLAP